MRFLLFHSAADIREELDKLSASMLHRAGLRFWAARNTLSECRRSGIWGGFVAGALVAMLGNRLPCGCRSVSFGQDLS